jgi:polysaccharide export outer membrane protein
MNTYNRKSPWSLVSWLAVFPLLGLLAACGGGGAVQHADKGARSAVVAPDPTVAANSDYVIGSGDTLRIQVLQNAELNAEVPVRPDGKISTPLVNDVVAAGKTPSQLSKDIEQTLGQFVRNPTVSVIVIRSTGDQGKVQVVGQAVAPKAVAYRSGMTLMDLMVQVGGLSQFAAGNRAKIIRSDGSGSHEIRVHLKDLLNGKISENVALKPGDLLVIPQTLF